MSKIKKRLISFLAVFAMIISLFPVEFNGQVANAATTSDPTALKVYVEGSSSELTATTNSSNETVYSVAQLADDGFDIGVAKLYESTTNLIAQSVKAKSSISGAVINQQFDIVSINGASYTTAEGQAIINDIGVTVTTAPAINTTTFIVGKKITGLPVGVNKIKYKVTVTTEDIDYTAASKDSSGNTIAESAVANSNTLQTTEYSIKEITIYNGTSYATSKINSMKYKSYIGDESAFDDTTDEVTDSTLKKNNKPPFLYITGANPDSEIALKYTLNVPDSINALKYIMSFNDSISLDNASVYKNGSEAVEGSDYTINGKVFTGRLTNLTQSSDLVMIKLNSSSSGTNIQKTYAIEIIYNKLDASEDYSMYNAGITKYNYDSDDTVEAYIGKTFTVNTTSQAYSVYTGDIYIDQKATMISIDPTLIRNQSSDNVAYEVTNYYYDTTTKTNKTKSSVLKNGKAYIDFMAGSTNKLYVDVYDGTDGNKTSSSTLLARYVLNVNLLSTDTFAMNLAFDDNSSTDSTYLTQPGVSKSSNGEISFSTSRHTYDLYSTDKTEVKVSFTGTKSNNNEYLKFWTVSSIDGTMLKDATVTQSGDDYTVELGTDKELVVQAYYDSSTESASIAVGEKYVFYLPNNYDSSDTSTGSSESSNALLNSLKVAGATLLDDSGNSGFTSTTYEYTTTVAEGSTTAQITAIAQDDNVESITATVDGSSATYDLVSGTAKKITLDTSGSTTVNVVVIAQDGTTTKTYTVIIKNSSTSSDATLSNVILNTGEYTFSSSSSTTKVHVSQSTTTIKVTPVPTDSSSTVTVDGSTYSSSAISVSLKGSQKTSIVIVVTAEDGNTTKTYTLEVYRTDSSSWSDGSSSSADSNEDDQYYDDYYDCWVDTTKYEEWGKIGSKAAYFDKNNRQVKSAWITTGGKLYYLDSSGYRSSGWKVDDKDGKTYYLDPKSGEMRTGWMNLNNSWYYLGLNGVMKKGWLSLNGKWYYFSPNGQMVINQSMYIDGKTYSFGQDGAMN